MSGAFDFRNNVVFNWRHRTVDGGDETSLVNYINNYYKPGPGTIPNMRATFARIEQRSMYSPGSAWAEGGWYTKAPNRPGKWYVAGNIMDGSKEVTENNWLGMDGPEKLARVNTPFEGWPVVPHETASAAFESVLAKVGATLPKRDAVDKRVIEMVRTGKTITETGIIKDISEVGGYPALTYDPAKVIVDKDGDGRDVDVALEDAVTAVHGAVEGHLQHLIAAADIILGAGAGTPERPLLHRQQQGALGFRQPTGPLVLRSLKNPAILNDLHRHPRQPRQDAPGHGVVSGLFLQ